jgi:hypothetical protein
MRLSITAVILLGVGSLAVPITPDRYFLHHRLSSSLILETNGRDSSIKRVNGLIETRQGSIPKPPPIRGPDPAPRPIQPGVNA